MTIVASLRRVGGCATAKRWEALLRSRSSSLYREVPTWHTKIPGDRPLRAAGTRLRGMTSRSGGHLGNLLEPRYIFGAQHFKRVALVEGLTQKIKTHACKEHMQARNSSPACWKCENTYTVQSSHSRTL